MLYGLGTSLRFHSTRSTICSQALQRRSASLKNFFFFFLSFFASPTVASSSTQTASTLAQPLSRRMTGCAALTLGRPPKQRHPIPHQPTLLITPPRRQPCARSPPGAPTPALARSAGLPAREGHQQACRQARARVGVQSPRGPATCAMR